MKRLLYFLFISWVFFSACTSEKDKLAQEITNLESKLENDQSDTELSNQLLTKYQTHIEQFPEDEAMNPRYYYRMAGILYRMNKFQECERNLIQSLKEYPNQDNRFNVAMLLGNIYEENYGNPFVAQTIYQNMQAVFPNEALDGKVPKNIASTDQRLATLQQKIFNDSTGVINYQHANNFIKSSEMYALINPDQPGVPDMLFKAAETARTTRNHQKALEVYKWIFDRYQAHPKAPQALFLQAFTLDNELKQIESARVLYEQFIADYPSDEFVDDAQFLLNNLGKSDEEILKSFEQQQGQEN